jgi:hypothetical protein
MQITAFIRQGTSASLDLTPEPMRFSIAAGSMGLTEVVSTVEVFMAEDSMVAVPTAEATEDADNC